MVFSHPVNQTLQHPSASRRSAIQAGAIGLLGLGGNHLQALQASDSTHPKGKQTHVGAKSCIFIFLSGGLAQHDSFDMKPEAPDSIRGEFQPIATKTPGLQVCEHLPLLAHLPWRFRFLNLVSVRHWQLPISPPKNCGAVYYRTSAPVT